MSGETGLRLKYGHRRLHSSLRNSCHTAARWRCQMPVWGTHRCTHVHFGVQYDSMWEHTNTCPAHVRGPVPRADRTPRYHAHRDRKARLQIVVLDKRARELGLRSVLEDELHDREDDGHQAVKDEKHVDV